MNKYIFSGLLLTAAFANTQAQEESLLDSLPPDEPETHYVVSAFKSPRVINSHSMEMLAKGALDFRILHRFGDVTGGAYQLFGIDQATMRMSFDYGITKNLTVGIGRSTYKKELDGFIKYRILQQSTGARNMPISLIYVAGMTVDGTRWTDTSRKNYFTSRLGYYHQLIIGRKFNDILTLQLAPTLVHRNLVATRSEHNDLFAMGVGGRVRLTRRLALTADYYYVLNRASTSATYNPLSIGVDIETGGHVFQLHFSNAVGLNERAFIADTSTRWDKLEVRFGFNLSRVFQITSSHD